MLIAVVCLFTAPQHICDTIVQRYRNSNLIYNFCKLHCLQKKSGEISCEIAVSKYKELGSLTLSSRKTVIGLKISEYHLMLKNLDSELLKRLKVSWIDCAV